MDTTLAPRNHACRKASGLQTRGPDTTKFMNSFKLDIWGQSLNAKEEATLKWLSLLPILMKNHSGGGSEVLGTAGISGPAGTSLETTQCYRSLMNNNKHGLSPSAAKYPTPIHQPPHLYPDAVSNCVVSNITPGLASKVTFRSLSLWCWDRWLTMKAVTDEIKSPQNQVIIQI